MKKLFNYINLKIKTGSFLSCFLWYCLLSFVFIALLSILVFLIHGEIGDIANILTIIYYCAPSTPFALILYPFGHFVVITFFPIWFVFCIVFDALIYFDKLKKQILSINYFSSYYVLVAFILASIFNIFLAITLSPYEMLFP